MMLDHFGTTEDDWMRDSLDETRTEPPRDFAISETPHLLGRSVVALAADPDRHSFNSTTQDTHGLAVHYGFNDLDGSRPDSWSFITTLENDPAADPASSADRTGECGFRTCRIRLGTGPGPR